MPQTKLIYNETANLYFLYYGEDFVYSTNNQDEAFTKMKKLIEKRQQFLKNTFCVPEKKKAEWQVLKKGKVYTNTCLESEQDCKEHIDYCVEHKCGERSEFTYEKIPEGFI